MDSLRMCSACRSMKKKEELIRIVRIKGEMPRIDMTFKAQGRGAYICKSRECLLKAQKSRCFERTFKTEIKGLYENLGDIIDE